jgi:hypothetical protein
MDEALQRRTLQDALAGKRMAIREVAKWIMKREAWLAKYPTKPPRQKITIRAAPDPDNADAALALLGIAARDPAGADHPWNRAQLLLEPWAVQAALTIRQATPTSAALDIESRQGRPALQRAGAGRQRGIVAGPSLKISNY